MKKWWRNKITKSSLIHVFLSNNLYKWFNNLDIPLILSHTNRRSGTCHYCHASGTPLRKGMNPLHALCSIVEYLHKYDGNNNINKLCRPILDKTLHAAVRMCGRVILCESIYDLMCACVCVSVIFLHVCACVAQMSIFFSFCFFLLRPTNSYIEWKGPFLFYFIYFSNFYFSACIRAYFC